MKPGPGLLVGVVAAAGCGNDDPGLGWTASALDIEAFVLPSLSAAERAPIIRGYDGLDPDDLIPRGLLEDAILYYDVNVDLIPNPDYLVVVDLSLFSGEDRFWLVDLASGAVEPHKVAHGDGSDPDHDGYATLFGNVEGSHMSSLGFALTAEIYDGTHPHSMRLDGLSPDASPNGMANTNMRERFIVVHEASYVDDSNTDRQGRSNGCLALDPDIEVGVVDRIHDGALIYSAMAELAAPVGRAACGDGTCDGDEDAIDCPEDCAVEPPPDPGDPDGEAGGCSTGGGPTTVWLGLALAAVAGRRRRRVPSCR
jgi:MYXO-CTERM domain-containing protein